MVLRPISPDVCLSNKTVSNMLDRRLYPYSFRYVCSIEELRGYEDIGQYLVEKPIVLVADKYYWAVSESEEKAAHWRGMICSKLEK
jgi:hypothetical protein